MKKNILVIASVITLGLGAGVFAKTLLTTNAGTQPAFTLHSRVINVSLSDGAQSTLE